MCCCPHAYTYQRAAVLLDFVEAFCNAGHGRLNARRLLLAVHLQLREGSWSVHSGKKDKEQQRQHERTSVQDAAHAPAWPERRCGRPSSGQSAQSCRSARSAPQSASPPPRASCTAAALCGRCVPRRVSSQPAPHTPPAPLHGHRSSSNSQRTNFNKSYKRQIQNAIPLVQDVYVMVVGACAGGKALRRILPMETRR